MFTACAAASPGEREVRVESVEVRAESECLKIPVEGCVEKRGASVEERLCVRTTESGVLCKKNEAAQGKGGSRGRLRSGMNKKFSEDGTSILSTRFANGACAEVVNALVMGAFKRIVV